MSPAPLAALAAAAGLQATGPASGPSWTESIPVYKVDAFTRTRGHGNPAAVCLLKAWLPDEVMRSLAAELNPVSETAFLVPENPRATPSVFGLRWFSPKVEVPMCGHGTLAAAAVLLGELKLPGGAVAFETKSGRLTARRDGESIALDFPSETPVPVPPPAELLRALGVADPLDVQYAKDRKKLLVRVRDEAAVRAVKPDFARLMASVPAGLDVRGVIVTAAGAGAGTGGHDIVSRYFAPWAGVDEDPVTGSAHTVLGPYWSALLGKRELHAYQASERGGELVVDVEDSGRVRLIGDAVVLLKESLRL